ncbi:uncharacterized protein LAJ45_03496 [Morchella importuna]|uniref:uncharacterized protein n=1 Tax=Morchella importuna TaxID=1174673 RepID=UPI001E8DE5BE|nr:uncharacterized protein LAJ45_03496 [Morchella importuna]KAH8152655.1 hypothetical protein LAJ45_03496 [Morchella importuna]
MSNSTARELIRRLTFNHSPIITAFCVLSTGLVVLAAYFWSVVEKVNIPITPGLAEAATFLPAANFAAMRYIAKRPRGAQNRRPEWDIKTGIISILLIIIDTVVVTQSLNNMPKSAIGCTLERTWRAWFRTKDAAHIKAVQEALNCCGFNTFKDQAWPFPDNDTKAEQCSLQSKTRTPCYQPWSQTHQLSASVFMMVAAVTLLSKGIIFLSYCMNSRKQNQAPGTQRLLADGPVNGDQHNGTSRAIAGLRIRPDERARALENNDDDIESVIDENSRLLNNGQTTYETPGQLESGERPILANADNSVWDNEYSRGGHR